MSSDLPERAGVERVRTTFVEEVRSHVEFGSKVALQNQCRARRRATPVA